MTVLPPALKCALEEQCGLTVLDASPIGGGMINRAARVDTRDGALFVKWNESAPPGMLRQEARGLGELQRTRTIRVPTVYECHASGLTDDFRAGGLSHELEYLVMEYIPHRPYTNEAAFAETFGRNLALLHRCRPARNGFGRDVSNFIGRLPQPNDWRDSWSVFYRDCRLKPQMEIARELGKLPSYREKLICGVCDRLMELHSGLNSVPALLHGDLWSGNYLSTGNEPVVFDPAAYYGEREMEIAFMELFGGFPGGVFRAYDEAFPMQPGYEQRRPLHQLYPLLVHLNHFGEPYGKEVDRVCRLLVDLT